MPFELRIPSPKPIAAGALTREQLDQELMKGIASLEAGNGYSADEVDESGPVSIALFPADEVDAPGLVSDSLYSAAASGPTSRPPSGLFSPAAALSVLATAIASVAD